MHKNISIHWIRFCKVSSICLLYFTVCVSGFSFRQPSSPPSKETLLPPTLVPKIINASIPFYEGEASEEVVDRFFFSEESLDQVLFFYSKLTGLKVLAPERLPPVRISFDSQDAIPREDAIVAIESLLQMNGVSIAELGENFVRMLPSESIRFKSPSILEGDIQNLSPSERVYTSIFSIQYLDLEDATTMIGNMLTQGVGYLEVLKSSNSIIVTDSLVNLQRVGRFLDKLDQYSQKEIIVRKLRFIKASELKEKLTNSLSNSMKQFVRGSVAIDHDDRTNQVVIATDSDNRTMIECLIDTYDKDSMPFTSNEVIYLKHAQANDVVTIVNSLISEQQQSEDEVPAQSDSTDAKDVSSSSDNKSDNRVLQFSSYLAVEGDERSNAILIYGTNSDIESIKDIISNLDVLLPQVRIDVVITEVTLSNDNNRGIDRFGISYDENDEISYKINEGSDLPFSVEGTVSDFLLNSFTVTNFTLSTVFSTAKSDSNVNVISAPTLVTTHNREAIINAGESRPVITSSNTDSTGLSNRSQVSFRDIGVMLKVKPLIGSNGMVQMEIQQTVENVVDEVTIDGNSQPVIGKREATSFVSVASGEVVVLGGLQEKSSRSSEGKTHLLGSIPVLGRFLFSSNRDSKTTRELIIFIKPTVYSTPLELSNGNGDYLERMDVDVQEDLQDVMDFSSTITSGGGDESSPDGTEGIGSSDTNSISFSRNGKRKF